MRINKNNPLTSAERLQNIHDRYGNRTDAFIIPDIKEVFYGREVGYGIIESVSLGRKQ